MRVCCVSQVVSDGPFSRELVIYKRVQPFRSPSVCLAPSLLLPPSPTFSLLLPPSPTFFHHTRYTVAIDLLAFDFQVFSTEEEASITAPDDGAYVRGLFVEGATWDATASPSPGCLVESRPRELFATMVRRHRNLFNPSFSTISLTNSLLLFFWIGWNGCLRRYPAQPVIWLLVRKTAEDDERHLYQCPVYVKSTHLPCHVHCTLYTVHHPCPVHTAHCFLEVMHSKYTCFFSSLSGTRQASAEACCQRRATRPTSSCSSVSRWPHRTRRNIGSSGESPC